MENQYGEDEFSSNDLYAYQDDPAARYDRNRYVRTPSTHVHAQRPSQEYARESYGMNRSKYRRNKMPTGAIIAIIALLALLAVYIGGTIFFMGRFFPNTTVDGVDVSVMQESDAAAALTQAKDEWSTTIIDDAASDKEKAENTVIEADDIEYTVDCDDINVLISKQSAFAWPISFFTENKVVSEVHYDIAKMTEIVSSLDIVDTEKRTAPTNAKVEYDDKSKSFSIIEEEYGTLASTEAIMAEISHKMDGYHSINISIKADGCLEEPALKKDDESLESTLSLLNACKNASISYSIDGKRDAVLLDISTFGEWLTLEEDGAVGFDDDKMAEYYRKIGEEYDTVGTERTFISAATGRSVQVSGGDYGWEIDEAGEIETVKSDILAGGAVAREITYAKSAAGEKGSDWGDTYIDVDKTAQHIYYVKAGEVIFEADVVTGLPTAEKETTDGVWNIFSMEKNKTLVGEIQSNGEPEYRTPVAYWMQVTPSGIGFHDATWQPYFGGSLYTWNGSHGCINMSLSEAAALYDIAYVGLPVIIHY